MSFYEASMWINSIAPIGLGLALPCKSPFIGSIIYSPENCEGNKLLCGTFLQNISYILLTIVNAIVHTKSVILGFKYPIFFLVPGILFIGNEVNIILNKKNTTIKDYRVLQVIILYSI